MPSRAPVDQLVDLLAELTVDARREREQLDVADLLAVGGLELGLDDRDLDARALDLDRAPSLRLAALEHGQA